MANWTEAQEHSEGRVARAIEDQTAKLPSDTFLWAAVGAMAVSAGLQISGKQHVSNGAHVVRPPIAGAQAGDIEHDLSRQ